MTSFLFCLAIHNRTNDIRTTFYRQLDELVTSLHWSGDQFNQKYGVSQGRVPNTLYYEFFVQETTPDAFSSVLRGLPDRTSTDKMMKFTALFFTRQSDSDPLVGTPPKIATPALPPAIVISGLDDFAHLGPYSKHFGFPEIEAGKETDSPIAFKTLANRYHFSDKGAWYANASDVSDILRGFSKNGYQGKPKLRCAYVGALMDGPRVLIEAQYYGIVASAGKKIPGRGTFEEFQTLSIDPRANVAFSKVNLMTLGQIDMAVTLKFGEWAIRRQRAIPFPEAMKYIENAIQDPGNVPPVPEGQDFSIIVKK